MCILCIIEGFLDIIRMINDVDIGYPYNEEDELKLFNKAIQRQYGDEYVVITNEDGKTEVIKIPN